MPACCVGVIYLIVYTVACTCPELYWAWISLYIQLLIVQLLTGSGAHGSALTIVLVYVLFSSSSSSSCSSIGGGGGSSGNSSSISCSRRSSGGGGGGNSSSSSSGSTYIL